MGRANVCRRIRLARLLWAGSRSVRGHRSAVPPDRKPRRRWLVRESRAGHALRVGLRSDSAANEQYGQKGRGIAVPHQSHPSSGRECQDGRITQVLSDRERFSRQIRFVPLGLDGQDHLAGATAVIVGCGALGSVQALAPRARRTGDSSAHRPRLRGGEQSAAPSFSIRKPTHAPGCRRPKPPAGIFWKRTRESAWKRTFRT